jgi:hypothetical protein
MSVTVLPFRLYRARVEVPASHPSDERLAIALAHIRNQGHLHALNVTRSEKCAIAKNGIQRRLIIWDRRKQTYCLTRSGHLFVSHLVNPEPATFTRTRRASIFLVGSAFLGVLTLALHKMPPRSEDRVVSISGNATGRVPRMSTTSGTYDPDGDSHSVQISVTPGQESPPSVTLPLDLPNQPMKIIRQRVEFRTAAQGAKRSKQSTKRLHAQQYGMAASGGWFVPTHQRKFEGYSSLWPSSYR